MSIGMSAAPVWRKATHSQAVNGCVEVTWLPKGIAMRDSKTGDASPILELSLSAWADLRARLAVGDGRPRLL